MRFRPCIDLLKGRVVQIVGGTLQDDTPGEPQTNFMTRQSPQDFARMYARDGLWGGHVISLGPGNRDAARSALQAFPGGFHFGGGITPENAMAYLDAGASHVIVTSYVFSEGMIDSDRLRSLVRTVGKNRLVLDLSCRRRESGFWIVTDRWQKFTGVQIGPEVLAQLSDHCDEFLVHGVDVEGRTAGVEDDLVRILGEHSPIPTTYAGGVRSLSDLDLVKEIGRGRIDITVGSALDIFGGPIPYRTVVEWHRSNQPVQSIGDPRSPHPKA
jgi:phosphoribosylformimino-5-aminoimidazole carboxamide ribotide isomerase